MNRRKIKPSPKPSLLRAAALAVAIGCLALAAAAQSPAATPALPDAKASDPAALGWMQGSPPPASKVIRFADGSYYRFPQLRWTFANFRQMLPTTNVSRGSAPVSTLPRAERGDIDAISFTPAGSSTPMTWRQSLDVNYTDGIVVLHKGRIVYERYFGVLKPEGQHILMSVTKSFFGTLGASLIAEGRLDPAATVAKYVPELADSGFGDVTIRQLLDMTAAVKFSENYTDPNAEIWAHTRAGGVGPRPAGYQGPDNFYEYMATVKKEGEHGKAFGYKTVNTDVLGWVIRRVTGKSIGQNISERYWSKLGMEQDAYFVVDNLGNEFAGGGLNASLRDMARFGEMMRQGGKFNGQQVVPAAAIEDIRKGGDRAQFAATASPTLPGWSYRDMWWVSHNEHGAYAALGIHGQAIYIDPKAEMVIARFASNWRAGNAGINPTSLPAYHVLAKHLMADAH